MLFEVKRKLFNRSDRVKGVSFHPTEPWLLTGLYNGTVNIYNYNTGSVIKTFEVSEVPVRCVRFISRKSWFVAGSDDFQLRVFNYNTHEKVAAFEAHPDYIRCLTVHPTLPLVLTGSDDMTIKAWDWEKGWKNIQTYEGHTHYIMNIAVNPKDPNTFASACLDRTVKMWSLSSSTANYSMEPHAKGVNYVEFYQGADKPYIVTCSDDKTVKVWDYLSKSCVQTMEGHTNNVSFAVFHPNLPIIISGSEDGTVKIWNAGTYRIENTLSYALERAWCIALMSGANDVAVGFDEGVVVVSLGKDAPTYSMDESGKVVMIKNQQVLSANLLTLFPVANRNTATANLIDAEAEDMPSRSASPMPAELPAANVADGAPLPFALRDLSLADTFPFSLQHSPNGRFVALVGDNEWVIYTALAWRNKSFGPGLAFAWSADSNTYAVLESKVKVKLFRNFKEKVFPSVGGPGSLSKGGVGAQMEGVYSGTLLGARGTGWVIFWDWETGEVVRRIEVDGREIIWSQTGGLVAITTEDSFYILRYNKQAYIDFLESGEELTDEGVEEAFEIVADVNEGVRTAKWVGDCFIYTTTNNRLMYFVGTESYTISPLDTPLYLLGYIPGHSRIYLLSGDLTLTSYTLSLPLVEYQTAILRDDPAHAANILPTIPKDQLGRVARFLEGRGMHSDALAVATDPDHRFELAMKLDDLEMAVQIVRGIEEAAVVPVVGEDGQVVATPAKTDDEDVLEGGPEMGKWKILGDHALKVWQFDLAKEAFEKAGDASALMLLFMATGDRKGLERLARIAVKSGQNNLAFATLFQLGDSASCVDLLIKTQRAPEAALLARTYAPSQIPKAVDAWKADLKAKNRPKIADSIAHPAENADLFEEGWEQALALEKERGLSVGQLVDVA